MLVCEVWEAGVLLGDGWAGIGGTVSRRGGQPGGARSDFNLDSDFGFDVDFRLI